MSFKTKLNLKDNRQHRLPSGESQKLSGSTIFGIEYSGLTTGPNTNKSGTTSSIINIVSDFSGNTGTTVFNFGDSRMNIAQNAFLPLTLSNSGVTQNSGDIFVGNTSQTVDGNFSYLNYSGTSFDFNVTAITETSSGVFTGSGISTDVFFLSADTLDFTGRTIWSDVKGIHKTNKIIITDGATNGYVLTSDSEGLGVWSPPSGGTIGGTGYWDEGGENSLSINDNKGSHTIVGVSNYSIIGGGNNCTINNSSISGILSGDNNLIGNSDGSAIIGGSYNTLSGTSTDNSVIIGGSENKIHNTSNRTVVIGGTGIFGTVSDMVYVPDLTIDGLVSTDPIATDISGKIVAGASDARLKTNINNLSSALSKINSLRGVSYEWTEESQMGSGIKKYGLIAQEVQKVIPDMVRLRSKGDGMLTLSYTELVPWIIEAIKELSNGNILKNNTILETQTIASEDNNIELNYNGNNKTAIGGGLKVLHGISDGIHSEISLDNNGKWKIPSIITNNISLPNYSPKSSSDLYGDLGETVWDNDFIYIKTNDGWKRTELKTF